MVCAANMFTDYTCFAILSSSFCGGTEASRLRGRNGCVLKALHCLELAFVRHEIIIP
jgi:hypothetical protein